MPSIASAGFECFVGTVARLALLLAFTLIAPGLALGETAAMSREAIFTINAQRLGTAIIAFSDQAGIQVISSGTDVSERASPGVHGRYTVSVALTKLLAGTGLNFNVVDDHTVAIGPSVTRPASWNGRSLPPVKSSPPTPVLAATQTPVQSAQSIESPPASSENDKTTVRLAEVVVTGRRRSENLQSVPEAITAFSAQKIEDARIQRFSDFVAMTPNFEMFQQEAQGVFQMSIRGISQAHFGDAPVVMVVDGVTLPYPNSFTTPLYDVQSIEVLKGPQGALYGQNAIGGAVVITTKQPSNEFDGRLTGSYGKGNENQATVVFSGPIVKDKLLFRAAAFHHDFDGDIRYQYAPRDLANYLGDDTGRLDLSFLASDTFTADVSASYGKSTGGAQPLVPMTYTTASHIPNVSTAALNSTLVLGQPNDDYHHRTRRNSLDGSLKLLWNAGFAELSSVTAATRLHEHHAQDLDISNIPFAYLSDQAQLVDAFSEEVRLTSPSNQRLRWIVTGFLQRVHRETSGNIFANLALIQFGDTNPAHFIPLSFNAGANDLHLDSHAGAVQVNYDVLPDMEVTLAGRYDSDPRSQVTGALIQQRTFNKFQPKASLSYKPTPEQTYYATFAQGFRPGGFNMLTTPGAQPVFDAEETTTYEAGAKFSFFDQRASVSLAAYTTQYKNQQISLIHVTATAANASVFTIKKDTIQGFELEAQARLAAGLELGLAAGFQDATIKEFGNSLSGPGFDPASYVGKSVPLQSKYTLTASAQYSHEIVNDLQGFIHADVNRKGRLYWYADNRVSRSPFSLVNMKAGLRKDRWVLDLYGSNIFNTKYVTSYFDNTFVGAPGGFDFAYLGELSRYGVEATFRF
jgi:iron complex outermembrane receptor protein